MLEDDHMITESSCHLANGVRIVGNSEASGALSTTETKKDELLNEREQQKHEWSSEISKIEGKSKLKYVFKALIP